MLVSLEIAAALKQVYWGIKLMAGMPFRAFCEKGFSFEVSGGRKSRIIILATSATLVYPPLAAITEGYLCLKHVTK